MKTITDINTPSNGRFCFAECHRSVRKLSGVRECSRDSEQNLQFPFSTFTVPSIKCRTEPPFMGEGGVSLPNAPIPGRSVQHSVQPLRILGANHAAFQTLQPWRKQWISLSLLFHVVLRRKLAIWQRILNALLAWLAKAHAGSDRSTEMSRFC